MLFLIHCHRRVCCVCECERESSREREEGWVRGGGGGEHTHTHTDTHTQIHLTSICYFLPSTEEQINPFPARVYAVFCILVCRDEV